MKKKRRKAKPFRMTKKLTELGFLDPNNPNPDGVIGCVRIPCCGGKMPYQCEPIVPCVIIRSMCDESPVAMMEADKANEKQRKIDNLKWKTSTAEIDDTQFHQIQRHLDSNQLPNF